MITQSLASLSIQSETAAATAVTEVLGITPHTLHEIGDLTWSGRHPGRSQAPLHYTYSTWSYTVEREQSPREDESGFWSVRKLIDVFTPVAGRLRDLRPTYTYWITWSGFSDSWQGGFVIPSDLYQGLAQLDADLYGTAYLDGDELDENDASD